MRYQGGSTTGTFRLKALLLYLRDREGREKARLFAERIGGGAIVDDETRPLARTLWLRALDEFVTLAGEKSLQELSSSLVHPENLGAWSRVLRGAEQPEVILQNFGDGTEGLPGDRIWTAKELKPGTWLASAELSGAETLREREHLALALLAELEAIPLLVGASRARVELVNKAQGELEYRVEFFGAARTPLWLGAVFGGLWLLASALGHFWGLEPFDAIEEGSQLFVWVPALAFLGLGWALDRDKLRQAETNLQRVRIQALEREAALRQSRAKEISRPHEEPIIAGQYRVGAQLGVGATGAVWEATRLTDETKVALKLLRTAVVHDVRATDRLRREAEALGLSWHPHVVEVFDSGLLPSGVGFLVMERLVGETLAERLQRKGKLSLEETRQLGIQAADALLAVHSAGVIHRDIKPGNLFLHQPAEGPEFLKVIDFGVARVSWAETRLTRSGVRVGTVGYASLEQEEGGEIDGRTDIYGLGVSLRECLTGIAPPSALKLASVTEEELGVGQLPLEWREVLAKMTAPLATDRYSSAREVREALVALGGESDGTPPSDDHVDVA